MRERVPWGPIAFALYALSLVLPCVHVTKLFSDGMMLELGAACLAFGWGTLAWYANVLLLLAGIGNAYRAHELALCAVMLALGAALSVFALSDVRPFVGYYVWLASMVATGLAALSGLRARRADEQPRR